MTTHDRDKIIAAAEEADFDIEESGQVIDSGNLWITCKIETIYAIAFEAGRQAEREDCAKICDKYTEFSGSPSNFAENCAKSIRARSVK